MTTSLLVSMPGPVAGTIIVLTLVVVIYSVAKAIMRYLEDKKDDEDNKRKNP